MPDVEDRDRLIGLVDHVYDLVDVSPAPIQHVTQAGILEDGGIYRRMLVQTQDRALKPDEPCAGLAGFLAWMI